jgi:V8-like Glu-specific endopeptidase
MSSSIPAVRGELTLRARISFVVAAVMSGIAFGNLQKADLNSKPGVFLGELRGWKSRCTAILVAETLILTANHCYIRNKDGKFTFFPRLVNGRLPQGARPVEVVDVHPGDEYDLDPDWAIMELAEAPTWKGRKRFDSMRVVSSDLLKAGAPITTLGYSASFSNGRLASFDDCELDGTYEHEAYCGCTTKKGTSGGPVVAQIKGESVLVGIISGGMDPEKDYIQRLYSEVLMRPVPTLLTIYTPSSEFLPTLKKLLKKIEPNHSTLADEKVVLVSTPTVSTPLPAGTKKFLPIPNSPQVTIPRTKPGESIDDLK